MFGAVPDTIHLLHLHSADPKDDEILISQVKPDGTKECIVLSLKECDELNQALQSIPNG